MQRVADILSENPVADIMSADILLRIFCLLDILSVAHVWYRGNLAMGRYEQMSRDICAPKPKFMFSDCIG